MISSVFNMILLWYMSYAFKNIVIGSIPFEPWGMFNSMAQRGISTGDNKQVGLFFVFTAL